ncbi:hypothetical protein [Streptomyces sp. NRRL S-623]|uniref:hypothetical protein n=1 Tax=Streptomyces sp. NRRL S-623 TaxID=1463916 RepID=UPI001F32FAC9|nr:hypothetical protein [Streptomyces sp. NRRL S-623]
MLGLLLRLLLLRFGLGQSVDLLRPGRRAAAGARTSCWKGSSAAGGFQGTTGWSAAPDCANGDCWAAGAWTGPCRAS